MSGGPGAVGAGTGGATRAEAAPETRERIRAVAGALYVVRGHDGFSFGDIADAIGTTRANIHHHFGTKRKLMRELIEGFAADAEMRIERHWAAGDAGLSERMARQVADLRRFYDRYNPSPGDRNVWSPMSRLRLDLPALGEDATAALARANAAYQRFLTRAVEAAVARGELVAETPVEAVVRLLRVTFLSCGPITQDTGSFDEVERLHAALEQTILAAWGRAGRSAPS